MYYNSFDVIVFQSDNSLCGYFFILESSEISTFISGVNQN